MALEWIRFETGLMQDPRIQLIVNDKSNLHLFGAYAYLRIIIDAKGPKGVTMHYIKKACEKFGKFSYFRRVLENSKLFSIDDDGMIHSLPLQIVETEEEFTTLFASAKENDTISRPGADIGADIGATPELNLRFSSKKEDNLENLERERGTCVPKTEGLSPLSQEFSKRKFIPPTVEEVAAYCKEKGYIINAERFVSYYESTNWYLKDTCKMKNWRAAVRTWVNREKEKAQNDPANRREKDIHNSSYIEPYDGYLPPNAPPRPTPTAVWSISHDAWVEPYGPNRMKPIVGLKDIQKQ